MFDFPSFALNRKKGKKRQSTTNDAHTVIIIGLSLSLLPLTTHRHRRTRKEETKNHIVQSLLCVKLRVKETKRVRACSLLLLFAFQTTREFDDCFFLSGCETTTEETLFRPSLFLCDDGFCCVSFALLCHDARERERQTERGREKDTSSFFRDDAFRVFSKRGIKNSIVLQKMMRKR